MLFFVYFGRDKIIVKYEIIVLIIYREREKKKNKKRNKNKEFKN